MELLDNKLNKTVSMKNSNIEINDNYIKVFSDIDRKYFNNNGEEISNKDIFSNNELFAYKAGEKWGFIDKDGNIKVDTKYDIVTEFNSYGFAGIKENDKWGVINSNGEIIVEPLYNIDWNEPEFIGKYCRLNFGYGLVYYSNEL